MNPALILVLALGARASTQVVDSPRALLARLVETFSAADEARLRKFVIAWTPPGALVNQRVKNWGDLAKQIGPFKLVAEGKETDAEVDGFVTDRGGSRLVFMLYVSLKPQLHILGLQVRPAYAVEGPPPEFSEWSSLNELASKIGTAAKAPAMGIAVIRDGKLTVAVSGVRALDDPNPVEPDDVWSIGSIGKSLCSTVIGALIERGKLRWDEPLAEALPDLKMESGYMQVTLEQLMHHRGGVPQDLDFTGRRVSQITGAAKTPVAIRERYTRDILSRKPISAPGVRFAYSNAGYALLSVVAERAAGKPYEALLHEIIFNPLLLQHSYTDADELPKARPSGHVDGPNGLIPRNMDGPLEAMLAGAGGGLYMSLGDLATYGAAHLKGLRGGDGLLKATTIGRLHRGIPEMPQGRTYACGWSTDSVPGLAPFDGHNGSNGTMRSQIAIFPDANLVVVGIANRGGETEPAPGFIAVMAVGQRYAAKK